MSDVEVALTVTVEEAAALLRVGRDVVYGLVRHERLPHIKVGRRILIPRAELDTALERLAADHADLSPTARSQHP